MATLNRVESRNDKCYDSLLKNLERGVHFACSYESRQVREDVVGNGIRRE